MKEEKKRRNPKARSFEEIQQKLEQAKVSGDKFQIRVWTDVLNRLKSKEVKSF